MRRKIIADEKMGATAAPLKYRSHILSKRVNKCQFVVLHDSITYWGLRMTRLSDGGSHQGDASVPTLPNTTPPLHDLEPS